MLVTGLSDVDGPWEVMWLSIIKLGINWSENKETNMIQGVMGGTGRKKMEWGLKLSEEAGNMF